MGISQATFFNWKKKFGGLGVSELRRLRQLEEENFQLKKLVADLSLDKQMLQDVKKNAVRPRKKRELVLYFHAYRVSARRACNALQLARASWFYRSRHSGSQLLTMRMIEIAFTRVRYGYRRILTLLRREGFKDNHKRVYRIYRQEGLNLRMKRPRRSRMGAQRLERVDAGRVHQVWSMDFVSDQFFNGNRFRILTIVDNYSKKSPGLQVDRQIKGADVAGFLNYLKQAEGCVPERLQVDNGSEFISKEMDRWAYENKVVLDFSRPGKPTDNPYIESFNGKFRDECLSLNWFLDLDDARQKIEA